MEEHRDKHGILVVPGQMTVEECIADAEESVTSLTPSGLEVFYSWAPRRHYKLREHRQPGDLNDHRKILEDAETTEWREVPSVTSVLNVLDKSGALTWWGMKVGVAGVLELNRRSVLVAADFDAEYRDEPDAWDVTSIVEAMTREKLTVNHVKDAASTRGLSVHSAFESWCADQKFRPNPDDYPETEQGYIKGLCAFLSDLGDVEDVEAEVMVGSLEHGFAGRFDALLTKATPQGLVTKIYPKRPSKFELVPAGRILVDVKTSRNVYPSHALQLAAYELASVECGYGETDYRAVIHLTEDGRYEFVQTHAKAEDFLSVLAAHNTMSTAKGWT